MSANFSIASRFLCFCSGADLNILENECPSEIRKYAAIGATIVFTGLFATISGGYALYRIFLLEEDAIWYSIGFGLLWGGMIFNLDRYIVMSMRKGGSVGSEFWQALPRIAIAALISIVIAKPLEVKIFENRIARQILVKERQDLKNDVMLIDDIYKVASIKEEKESLESKSSDLSEQKTEGPKDDLFQEIYQSMLDAKNRYEKLDNELPKKIRIIDNERAAIKRNNRIIIRDSLGEYLRDSLPPEAINRRDILYKDKKKLEEEVKKAGLNYRTMASQVKSEREKHRNKMDSLISENNKKLAEVEVDKLRTDSIVGNEVSETERINNIAYSENFITQLEALGELTQQEDQSTLKWSSWFLMLLFFAIEIAPILVKLISKKGLYEEAVLAANELELAKNIEKKNRDFAIAQANQQTIIDTKAKLYEEAIQKFKETKASELASIKSEAELNHFLNEIKEFEVEIKTDKHERETKTT